MTTKEFIDSLFKDYADTQALSEFKEELQGNLEEKIASFVQKGMDEASAFQKATSELGDISALADEISFKKKQEVFEEAYMDIKRYMKPVRVFGYVAFGITLTFGIIVALIVYFSSDISPELSSKLNSEWFTHISPNGIRAGLMQTFASLMPFVVIAVAGWTFLGLTQESAAVYPMKTKRALLYTAAAALLVFGITVFPIVFFSAGQKEGLISAIAVLIPFTLTGGGGLAFLVLTEKDRLKPWARARYVQNITMFANPQDEMRFGLFSGAIWILAFALFLLLGFLLSFKYSWLTFVFAVAFQLFMQGILFKASACEK